MPAETRQVTSQDLLSDADYAKVRRELRGALRAIHDELRLTSVFVTHDHEEAFTLADRVAILNSGEVEQSAPPKEIVGAPASDFVRQFLD